MQKWLNKIANPLAMWLLRSPLHFLMSNKVMLITVIGRKTGKRYTTPVQYGQQANTLFVITTASYQWWKNLQGGAQVKLILQGQEVDGFAEVAVDAATIADYFRMIYPSMTEAQIDQLSPNRVAVRIALQPEPVR